MNQVEMRIVAKQIKQRVSVQEAAAWFGYEYDVDTRNPCPVCENASKSKNTCALYDEGKHWYCYHCADGGDVIDWLACCQDTSKGAAITQLAARLGLSGDVSDFVKYLRERLKDGGGETIKLHHKKALVARSIKRLFWQFYSRSTLTEDAEYILGVHEYMALENRAWYYGTDKIHATLIKHAKYLVTGANKTLVSKIEKRCHTINKSFAQRMHANCSTASIERFGKGACDAFMIGHAPRTYDIKDEQLHDALGLHSDKGHLLISNRTIFPIRDLQGNVIAFAGRRIDEDQGPKYINTKDSLLFNKSRTLYGLYEAAPYIRKHGYVIIVEGYADVIALAAVGIRNVVAPMGTALTEAHADIIARFTREAVTMFDGDDAGTKARRRAHVHLQQTRIRPGHVELPDGQDPDTMVKKIGAIAMLRLIKEERKGPQQTHKHDMYGYSICRERLRRFGR